MKTNRRKFIGTAGLSLTGMFMNKELVKGDPSFDAELKHNFLLPNNRCKPIDVKINVKLIYYALIHSTTWEGPCRYSEMLGPDHEKQNALKGFEGAVNYVKSNLGEDAVFLEPVYLEFHENYKIEYQDLKTLEVDKEKVDLYVLMGYQFGSHPELYFASVLGDLYKKPIVASAHYGRTTAAYLNSIGLEGYAVYKYGDLRKLISLLRTRKAFKQSDILLITDLGGAIKGPGYMRGSVEDFADLKERFGMNVKIIRFNELSDERNKILTNKNYLKDVESISENLIRNAQKVNMDNKMFYENVLFYFTIKSLMNKYNCNSFSIDCIEFCSTRLPEKWRITPCITFSLLNGEGYPTACEGEIGCLLAMNLFMTISKKSPYLGNLNPFTHGSYDPDQYLWIKNAEKDKVNFSFGHNVPGLKMQGFYSPDLPYEIRNFIPAKPCCTGWGASFKIDFTRLEEKTITIGRFNPLTTKLLVTKGEMIGMRGFDLERCSTEALIHIKDPEEFHLKTVNYGHHYVGVFGDYVRELMLLAEILNIQIELHDV